MTSIREAARALRTRALSFRDVPGHETGDRVLEVVALIFLVVMAMSESVKAHDGLLVGLLLSSWLPLFARHRWPLTTLAVVVGVECAHLAMVPLTYPVQFNSIPVSTMVACYTVARQRHWRAAWRACGIAATVLLVVGLTSRQNALAANMFSLDLVLGAAAAGVLVRSRHQRLSAMEDRAIQAEKDAAEEARRQVADERMRMARELHDVIAHNLTLVNAQSGVAEYLVRTDPDAAARALQDLTKHTSRALDELRATVGLLRQEDDESVQTPGREAPTPGVADLPTLVEHHRSSGLDVSLSDVGEPRVLSPLGDLAAFRISQEALTNARKHAPGSTVAIGLEWATDQLILRVENGPSPLEPAGHRGVGTRHGIIGMRERALASLGDLTAEPTPDGGFRVVAHLPLDAPADTTEETS